MSRERKLTNTPVIDLMVPIGTCTGEVASLHNCNLNLPDKYNVGPR